MTRFIFLFFFATLPFQFALSPMPGIDLHVSRLFVIGLSGLWIVHSLIRRSWTLPTKFEAFLLLSIFFLSAFSLFFAENFSWGLRKLSFLLSFFPIFFVAFSLFREVKSRKAFARVIIFGSAISGIVGIVQFLLPFIIGLDPAILLWQHTILPIFSGHTFSDVVSEYSSMVVNVGGTNFLRASAFFPDPHIASFFWGMTLPFSITLAFRDIQPKTRAVFLVTSFIILLADILTFSRGGYIALLITALFTLGILFSELIRKHIFAFSISGALLVLITAIPNPLSSRLISTFDLSDHSTSGRLAIWIEAVHIIERHPFIGVGLGNYSNTVFPSATYREPRYAHNTLLDIAAETGIIPAILFFILLSTVLTRSLTKYQSNPLIFTGGCSLLIFSLHGLFETPLYSVHILPLFLSLIAFVL